MNDGRQLTVTVAGVWLRGQFIILPAQIFRQLAHTGDHPADFETILDSPVSCVTFLVWTWLRSRPNDESGRNILSLHARGCRFGLAVSTRAGVKLEECAYLEKWDSTALLWQRRVIHWQIVEFTRRVAAVVFPPPNLSGHRQD